MENSIILHEGLATEDRASFWFYTNFEMIYRGDLGIYGQEQVHFLWKMTQRERHILIFYKLHSK